MPILGEHIDFHNPVHVDDDEGGDDDHNEADLGDEFDATADDEDYNNDWPERS